MLWIGHDLVGVDVGVGEIEEPAGVGQEVADGDRPWIVAVAAEQFDRGVRQVALDGIVEVEQTLFPELENADRNERLGVARHQHRVR